MGVHRDMGGAMDMPLLPQWLRIGWAVAFGAVVLLHLWHAWSMPGQRRWWHTGHAVMALGMLLMYLIHRSGHDGLYRAGVVLFGALALAVFTTAGALYRREGVLNALWVAFAVDMLVMASMLLPADDRPGVVGGVFVVYLAGQTVAWLFGLWARLPSLRAPAAAPVAGTVPVTAPVGGGTAASAAAPAPDGAPLSTESRPVAGLAPRCSIDVRVSLAVMAAGMAYMLAVM